MFELLDFWAPWCAPCKMMLPVVESLTAEMGLPLRKVNVDEEKEVREKYGVRSVPTLVLLKDGVEVGRVSGARPRPSLKVQLEQWMAQ